MRIRAALRRPRRAVAAVLTVAAIAATIGCNRPSPAANSQQGPLSLQTRVVRIAAASDLRYALEEITAQLTRAQSDLDLEVAYGSSGTFFAQIVNGAPYDLFMSADVEYPRQLAGRGLILPGSEF